MDKLALFALLLQCEAGNQSLQGQIAVANVVVNRMKDPRWGDTVESVALQPYQFSCFNNGIPEAGAAGAFFVIAEVALSGFLLDVTGGADHYHADYVQPEWAKSLEMICIIGNHIFYR